jgi:hypothetical protein
MNKAVFIKVASLGVLGAMLPAIPAHAVVLEQKWQPGQNLSYQTEINGTANVQAPADMPFIFAGVPLEVEIDGKGLAEMKTLKVDDSGVGTVLVRIPSFNLQAQAMGQKGQVTLVENTSKFLLNGKALKLGDGTNPLAKPTVAMRFSKDGRLVGIENLAPAKPAPAADPRPVAPADAVDRAALMVASITQALPTLWPGRDVKNGDTWKADISWPVPSATDPKKMVPTQFGQWDLTLKGEEMVDGRILQRVGLVGTINVDSAQFMPADQKTKAANLPHGKAKQEINGDVWLDAKAGQIVRADMIMGARFEGGQSAKSKGMADFTGSILFNLKSAA